MKYILLTLIPLLLSCNSMTTNLYEGNFYDVVKIADSLDKNIWMILGGGKNCEPCNRVIRDMKKNKLFEKYKNDFIFYKCNTIDSSNLFLQHIFLMTSVPNSYIIDRNKNVVSYLMMNAEANHVEIQLDSFVNNFNVIEPWHSQFKSNGNELLRMQNTLLKATYGGVDNIAALKLIDSSINIEPCFYNLYYKSKLLDKMGLKNEADSCADLCLSYVKGGYQTAVYDDLIKSIRRRSTKYQSEHKEFSIIQFQDTVLNCGYLKNRETTPIVVKYKNSGTKPLIILDVLTSCGCTKAEWSKKPLMPGDSSQMIIKYDADTRGEFYRTVDIISNSEANVNRIALKGIIK